MNIKAIVTSILLYMQSTHAMNWLCCKPSVPEENVCTYENASDEFRSHVKHDHFKSVLVMLRYDKSLWNEAIEGYDGVSFLGRVMKYYGLMPSDSFYNSWISYGDKLRSSQEWRLFLELLLATNIDFSKDDSNFGYSISDLGVLHNKISPLINLLFIRTGTDTFWLKTSAKNAIQDALLLFRKKKVFFNPRQLFCYSCGNWECGDSFKYSIFYYLFSCYQECSDHRDFLEQVIDDVVALGIDTEFLYSYAYRDISLGKVKETYFIQDYLNNSNRKLLKEVFEMACWKRDMKWPCHLCEKEIARSYDVRFGFQ